MSGGAHDSFERFETGHQIGTGEDPHGLLQHGRTAALVVAVIAAFLAVATFLSNEAVKEVITGETERSTTASHLETNRLKIDVAEGNSQLLRVLGAGGPREAEAAAAARDHDERVERELAPTDAHLGEEISTHQSEADDADSRHLEYELAEVGLQVGIVLASVSIITRRRWLLAGGGAVAAAGIVLLAVGLLFT